MARAYTTVLATLLAMAGTAPDAAGAAPAAIDSATVTYVADGVRVIHRTTSRNDIVAVNLYLLGGSAQLDSATAGIEAMLLRASERGTAAYPGREARLALARTGSRITISTEPDWTLFGFRGLQSEFDSTWSVFSDRVMRPALEPQSVEVVRGLMLRSVRNSVRNPDARVRDLAQRAAFAAHAYLHDPEGTEASLAGITIDMMRDYHARRVVRSRMLLVVVGNVSPAQVQAAIGRTFAQLPQGSYTWSLPPSWSAQKSSVTVHEQSLPTNYILGYFAGPPSDSKDYHAFRMAVNILAGFAASEIRKSGLSYAGYAPFLERGASGGGIYVSTTRPDTVMRIFNNTVEYMRENTIRRYDLQRYYDQYITSYYSMNESNAEQADFLARHELLRGDWRLAGRYMDEIKAVQGHEIRAATRRYVRGINYAFLGNAAQVPRKEMEK